MEERCRAHRRAEQKVDWLDKLSLKRAEKILLSGSREDDIHSVDDLWGCPLEEIELQTFCCLVIEMPSMPHEVSKIFIISFQYI
jgi:hypothetical protein